MEHGDSSMQEALSVQAGLRLSASSPTAYLRPGRQSVGMGTTTATCMACAPSEESAHRPGHVGTTHMCVCHRVQQGAGRSPSAPKRMPQQGAHKTQVQLVRERMREDG